MTGLFRIGERQRKPLYYSVEASYGPVRVLLYRPLYYQGGTR